MNIIQQIMRMFFRIRQVLFIFCLPLFLFASSDVLASIAKPPSDYILHSTHIDITNEQMQYAMNANRYGGNGVESMLDVTASLLDLSSDQYAQRGGGDSWVSAFYVKARGELPEGFDPNTTLIPISGSAAAVASITGSGSVGVTASVHTINQGSLVHLAGTAYSDTPISLSGVFFRDVPLNTTIYIDQDVSFNLFNDDMGFNNETKMAESKGIGPTEIQAVVDPFVYIDPDWLYATNFAVYDAWDFEVTREWMNTVPIPGAAWLLGTGLIGIVGISPTTTLNMI